MFAFVLALLFGIIMRFRGLKRILALTLLLVSSLALSLVAQEEIKTAQGFVLRSHESTLDTLAGRTRKWEVLLPLWATESPWFGFGFGAERHFRRHKEIYGEKIDAHSQFVFLLISGGLISLFLFLFWQISLAHRIFRVLRTASFTKLRTSTIFFGLFFLLITTQMFTSNPFMMHSGAQNILEAFVVLGLHATLCTEMTKKTPLLQHE